MRHSWAAGCRSVNVLPLYWKFCLRPQHHIWHLLLKMGERLQSQKSYVCSFFDCKAKFSKSWKLEAHLCKHTGLVSGSDQLGAKQNNEKSGHTTADIVSVLLTTVSPPSPKKPFSCENCDKSFCTRYQLSRHELNHSGEKPHKWATGFLHFVKMVAYHLCFLSEPLPALVSRCVADGCSEAFVTSTSLKTHMARVHQRQKNQYKVQ